MLRLIKSFGYAIKGIVLLLTTEKNFMIHAIAAIAVIIAGFCFNVNPSEWCILFICIAMVFTAEGFNTAIEKLTDIVSPDQNEKAGVIKDMAAGAVLIAAVITVIIALIIFIPKIS